MVSILSETEGETNKKQGIKKREHENNSEKILDNCKLGLDVFVVHGDIISVHPARVKFRVVPIFRDHGCNNLSFAADFNLNIV